MRNDDIESLCNHENEGRNYNTRRSRTLHGARLIFELTIGDNYDYLPVGRKKRERQKGIGGG